jgi:hypothetical protein
LAAPGWRQGLLRASPPIPLAPRFRAAPEAPQPPAPRQSHAVGGKAQAEQEEEAGKQGAPPPRRTRWRVGAAKPEEQPDAEADDHRRQPHQCQTEPARRRHRFEGRHTDLPALAALLHGRARRWRRQGLTSRDDLVGLDRRPGGRASTSAGDGANRNRVARRTERLSIGTIPIGTGCYQPTCPTYLPFSADARRTQPGQCRPNALARKTAI